MNKEKDRLVDLLQFLMTPGTILEPSVTMPKIKFSSNKQTAVKELTVRISSAMTKSEEYFHQVINGVREST